MIRTKLRESREKVMAFMAFALAFYNVEATDVKAQYQIFKRDSLAQNFLDRGIELAVGVLVIGLLTAYLLPIALDELAEVETSDWGSAEAALFGLLPVFFVLAILLWVVNKATE
ncbi:MAG: hypothetical protein ACOC4M_14105 [Promethearchaeia archaeon]